MNWRLWWQWAVEHNSRGLGLVFIILGATRYVVLPFVGRRLYIGARFMRRAKVAGWHLMLCLALYVLSDALEEAFGLAANIDMPKGLASGGVHYSAWFAWWYWLGKGIKWVAAMGLAWAVFLYHPDDREELKDAAKRRSEET